MTGAVRRGPVSAAPRDMRIERLERDRTELTEDRNRLERDRAELTEDRDHWKRRSEDRACPKPSTCRRLPNGRRRRKPRTRFRPDPRGPRPRTDTRGAGSPAPPARSPPFRRRPAATVRACSTSGLRRRADENPPP